MHIIAFGDIHSSYENIYKISELSAADLVIITGDITNFGGWNDAKKIIEIVMSINNKVFAVLGNMDRESVNDYLTEIGINLHKTGKVIDDTGIFGVGGSNPTPFNTPTEYSEIDIENFAKKAHGTIGYPKRKIFVSHAPPYGTMTDKLKNNIHVGSSSIRKFIKSTNPDLCLTGHIHESQAVDWLGETQIINPGMLAGGKYIEVVLRDDKLEAQIKSYK